MKTVAVALMIAKLMGGVLCTPSSSNAPSSSSNAPSSSSNSPGSNAPSSSGGYGSSSSVSGVPSSSAPNAAYSTATSSSTTNVAASRSSSTGAAATIPLHQKEGYLVGAFTIGAGNIANLIIYTTSSNIFVNEDKVKYQMSDEGRKLTANVTYDKLWLGNKHLVLDEHESYVVH